MSSNDSGSSALGVIVIAAAVAWGVSKGWFYQTGQEWFDTCWASINTKAPTTAAEATAWAQCEPQTKKALFDAGYVFGGNPEYAATPELKALEASCPSNWTDIPMSGVHVLAIDLLQKDGGPQWLDKFMPPDRMIVRTFDKRWPNCNAVRVSNGFPKIVQKGDGFDWAAPCQPCEAEKASMGKQARAVTLHASLCRAASESSEPLHDSSLTSERSFKLPLLQRSIFAIRYHRHISELTPGAIWAGGLGYGS